MAALVLLFAMSAFAQRKPVYEVYAIRYAITPDYPISDLVYGADPNRKADIAMMIWLVRGGGHNIGLTRASTTSTSLKIGKRRTT